MATNKTSARPAAPRKTRVSPTAVNRE
ncbi:MAG: hypothetical protein RLY78_2453, partial [Pseudomonadota bacterium]